MKDSNALIYPYKQIWNIIHIKAFLFVFFALNTVYSIFGNLTMRISFKFSHSSFLHYFILSWSVFAHSNCLNVKYMCLFVKMCVCVCIALRIKFASEKLLKWLHSFRFWLSIPFTIILYFYLHFLRFSMQRFLLRLLLLVFTSVLSIWSNIEGWERDGERKQTQRHGFLSEVWIVLVQLQDRWFSE